MSGWIPATSGAEAIEALAQAMRRTGYAPAALQDEFHDRVAADAIIRELRALGYAVMPVVTKDGTEDRRKREN